MTNIFDALVWKFKNEHTGHVVEGVLVLFPPNVPGVNYAEKKVTVLSQFESDHTGVLVEKKVEETRSLPTEADQSKWIEDYEDYLKSVKYKDDRSDAYAPLNEQLDMIYWDQENSTTTWVDHIKGVKDTYPKP